MGLKGNMHFFDKYIYTSPDDLRPHIITKVNIHFDWMQNFEKIMSENTDQNNS